MRKTALAASAAFVIASGAMAMPASAADLDFFEPAPPPFVPTWQGFYFGGHVGYGEAKFRVRSDIDVWQNVLIPNDGPATQENVFSESFSRSFRPDGLLGGVQAGYNWQMDSLVFGIEGDISFTDMRRSRVLFDSDVDAEFGDVAWDDTGFDEAFSSVRTNLDFLASVRGRIGFAADNMLFYGTGGVAWADANVRSRFVAVHDDPNFNIDETRRRNLNDFGFVLGGGASWMVIPQTFSVGVEGLFYFFDKRRTIVHEAEWEFGNFSGDVENRVRARLDDVWVIRLRGDLHF
jgi:outer membrane immunogenic protein